MRIADIYIPGKFNPPAIGSKMCQGIQCAQFETPAELISTLLPNILILAGVIFFGLIIGGGFSMISGAGKESSAQDKAKAQAAITYGIIGFLLVISAYFILQVVGVVTGINFINTPYTL